MKHTPSPTLAPISQSPLVVREQAIERFIPLIAHRTCCVRVSGRTFCAHRTASEIRRLRIWSAMFKVNGLNRSLFRQFASPVVFEYFGDICEAPNSISGVRTRREYTVDSAEDPIERYVTDEEFFDCDVILLLRDVRPPHVHLHTRLDFGVRVCFG